MWDISCCGCKIQCEGLWPLALCATANIKMEGDHRLWQKLFYHYYIFVRFNCTHFTAHYTNKRDLFVVNANVEWGGALTLKFIKKEEIFQLYEAKRGYFSNFTGNGSLKKCSLLACFEYNFFNLHENITTLTLFNAGG